MPRDPEYRQRVLEIHDFIIEHLYFNRADLFLEGKRFNSAVLLSLFTALNMGKELIIGEPGLGKTTSAEYVCSLFYRIPIGIVWGSEVSGHPEQTEEKIVGRPDLGELNKGNEKVVWSYFAQMPAKIVDEINRLPETKQSMILDGVDRGNWEYLNEMVINDEYCLFATANYQDMGTNTIIAPLIDRFDVTIESRYPGPNIAILVGQKDRKEKILRHADLEREIKDILSRNMPYEKRMEMVEESCTSFGKHFLDSHGIRLLSLKDRITVRKEVSALPFDQDADAFFRMVLSELSFCHEYGQKRSVDVCKDGCHFTGYLCHSIKNCASNRLPLSLRSYCSALAWFLGTDQVRLEHVRLILPYTIAHRIQWNDDFVSQREKITREDPLQIFLAKEAVKEVSRRYSEQSDHLKYALSMGYRGCNGEKVEHVEGDDPIYFDIKKDMERAL